MADPIPSNSITAFKQSSAPVGWTKLTALNDHAIRINSTGAGSAVSNRASFSTIFSDRTITGDWNSTATINAAPNGGVGPHTHPYSIASTITCGISTTSPSTPGIRTNQPRTASSSGSAGSNSPHTHSVTPTTSGTAAPWNLDLNVSKIDFAINYVDVIIAQRN